MSTRNFKKLYIAKVFHTTIEDTISIKGRWYHSSPFSSYKEDMFANKAKKDLWTAMQKHDEENRFDQVLHFGNADNEFAYAQLMALIPVIMNVYVTKYLKAAEIM